MSRDHYRGVPKTRDAVVDSSGYIKPLGKLDTSAEIVRHKSMVVDGTGVPVVTIYATATGNDSTGDGSLANPFKTFRRAVKELPSVINDTIYYIDLTDLGTEVYTERYSFPRISSNQTYTYVLSDQPGHQNFALVGGVNIIATPTVLDTVSITGTSTNSTTGMRAYTDSSKSWTPDEFKGKFVAGANIFELGTIYANTEDTIYVACSSAITGPLSILEPSAELKYGPATDSFFEGSMHFNHVNCNMFFGGIKFSRNASSGAPLTFWGPGLIDSMFCSYDYGVSMKYGGFQYYDACFIDKAYAQDGTGVTIRQSYMKDLSAWSVHGDGGVGTDSFIGVRFENCPSLGHGGNAEWLGGYTIDYCSVVSGTSTGIDFNGGTGKIRNTEIIDCNSTAINCEGPGRIQIYSVVGTGNGGYGLKLTNGSQVLTNSSMTVTGSSGDLKVGVLPVETWTSFNTGFSARLDTTAVSGTLSRIAIPTEY